LPGDTTKAAAKGAAYGQFEGAVATANLVGIIVGISTKPSLDFFVKSDNWQNYEVPSTAPRK
jgi:hypothetical protein